MKSNQIFYIIIIIQIIVFINLFSNTIFQNNESLLFINAEDTLPPKFYKPLAIHYDIEPQALEDFDSNIQEYSQHFLDITLMIIKIFRNLNTVPGLRLNVDIPFWFNQVLVSPSPSVATDFLNYCKTTSNHSSSNPNLIDFYGTGNFIELPEDNIEQLTQPLNVWVQNFTQRIAIMDFRDKAEGEGKIIDLAKNAMEYASKINTEVIISVETKCTGVNYTSFCEEGLIYLESETKKVNDYFIDKKPYRGFAIHDYAAWKIMEPRFPNGTIQFDSPQVLANNEIPRSIYLWNYDETLDIELLAEFWQFCRRHSIETIYMEAEHFLWYDQFHLNDLVQEANDRGFNVELLLGHSHFIFPNMTKYVGDLTRIAVDFVNYGPRDISNSSSNLIPSFYILLSILIISISTLLF